MTIDKFYLDEARRIRVEFLKNLEEINKRVPLLEEYKNRIVSYKDSIDSLVSSNINDFEKQKQFIEKLTSLDKEIETLENEMQPYHEMHKKLESDSIKLKDMIQEKYINITIEEIKKQIIPYISDLE